MVGTGEPVVFFWGMCIGILLGYIAGYRDGKVGKPPPPLKGTYDSGEHEDRVHDYPEDWS